MEIFFEFILAHWALWLLFLCLLASIIYLETSQSIRGVKLLSVQQMIQLINHQQAILIDVRNKALYQKSHINAAIHLDAESLDIEKLNKLSKNQKFPIIFYCQHGQTAIRQASRLLKNGLKNPYALKGGFEAWKQANLPVK
jgi:rhodanese-related sulfurtransferase